MADLRAMREAYTAEQWAAAGADTGLCDVCGEFVACHTVNGDRMCNGCKRDFGRYEYDR
jgi:hypothetical protein